MAVNDLSLSVQFVGHCWQRRFLLKFIFKFSGLNSDLSFINLFIGAIIVTILLILVVQEKITAESHASMSFAPAITRTTESRR